MDLRCFVVVLVVILGLAFEGYGQDAGWDVATATFYGDIKGGETRTGACGYDDTIREGYGLETTALSTVLFNGGATCGACYQIKCFNSTWCHPGTITVTGTNLCPPNWSKPSSAGGWCNPPRKHFDLTMLMFLKIGVYKAGIIPVQYRRVRCVKTGGIRFEVHRKTNPDWFAVLVYNVGGAGDVKAMSVKGSRTGWVAMSRNWGQIWQTGVHLVGQPLSFRVTTGDGRMVESDNVVAHNWQPGQTFVGKQF